MKKLTLFIFILSLFSFIGGFTNSPVFAKTLPSEVAVVLETSVYKQASLTSEIYSQDNKAIILEVGTTLKVDVSFENDLFYKVKIYQIIPTAVEDDYGYVLIAHTLDSTIQSPAKKLDANAKVKNDNSIIYNYNYSTQQFEQTTFILNKDTAVRILDGYNTNKEYTKISFLDDDNKIVTYYIQTINLSVSGVNYSLIVAIIILISCAGVVTALFGVKRKKSKK